MVHHHVLVPVTRVTDFNIVISLGLQQDVQSHVEDTNILQFNNMSTIHLHTSVYVNNIKSTISLFDLRV